MSDEIPPSQDGSGVPQVPIDREYWFVRTQDGAYYSTFREYNFVAIGPSSLDFDRIKAYAIANKEADREISEDFTPEKQSEARTRRDKLKNELVSILVESDEDKSRQGAASSLSQLLRFYSDLKIGDVVIIPNRYGIDWSFGIVTSDPKWLKKQLLQPVVPYTPLLHRTVDWVTSKPKLDVDSNIRLQTYGPSALKKLNNVADKVDQEMYDLYKKGNSIDVKILVQTDDEVYVDELARVLKAAQKVQKKYGTPVEIQANFGSPGEIIFGFDELVQVGTFLAFAGFTLLAGAVAISGGKVKFKDKSKDAKADKAKDVDVEIETPGIISSIIENRESKAKDKRLDNLTDKVLADNKFTPSEGAMRYFTTLNGGTVPPQSAQPAQLPQPPQPPQIEPPSNSHPPELSEE